MRYVFVILILFSVFSLDAQTLLNDNFENYDVGLDLTTKGFVLSKGSSYTGTVTANVGEDNGNKFARMIADVNASANMQIAKTIDVEPGKPYNYSVESKGPFKRQLRVYTEDDVLISSSADYKPSNATEEVEWKMMEVNFVPDLGVNKVKIAFFHYWSGTIDIDNFKVELVDRQSSFYLSSSEGDDNNEGTKNAPWKTLDKISSTVLFPGDSVLFKSGDTFNGHFVVNGSGNAENKILISSFGEGDKPVITGQVGVEGGGDYQEAILVVNNDNLIFDGLEVQNERLVMRSGVADTDAYGMYIKNTGISVMRNLVFRNMIFKNVFAVQPILDPEDFNTIQVSGLGFQSSKNIEVGKEKNIDGVLIEDCYFGNLQRFGIQFKHSGGNEGVGNDSINRNMNIHIHNNEFYYNGGTGVLPNSTYNCLIENNIFDHPGASTDPRMPGRGSSIWNINAINTIMQYNMCLSTRGYLDSHGIHIDNNNVNTFVQYNYMEDCEGGFVEILRGNTNAVYRFNVSVNDGWRVNETWTDSNHTIWVTSDRWNELVPTDGVYIYNNTCVINKPYTTSMNLDGKNMFVYNNIWSSTNGAGMGTQNPVVRNQDTPFYMSNNLFEGTVDPTVISWDSNPIIGDAKFVGTGEDKNAFQLLEGSSAINAGVAMTGPAVENAGYGVFKNVPSYPNVDFYGNPIDLSSGTPNIGACNSKVGIEPTGLFDVNSEYDKWLVYPVFSNSKIHIINKGGFSGSVSVSLYNLKGQVLQITQENIHPLKKELDVKLTAAMSRGIYILNIQGAGVSHSRRFVKY